MMLNISTRNCRLKPSDIFLMGMFLNTEKSRLAIPGPISVFLPELPLRLKQTSGGRGAPKAGGGGLLARGGLFGSVIGPRFGGFGSQLAFQKAKSGAVGS